MSDRIRLADSCPSCRRFVSYPTSRAGVYHSTGGLFLSFRGGSISKKKAKQHKRLAPKKWSGARRICARYRSHMPSHSAKPDATQFEMAHMLHGKSLILILVDVEIASDDLEDYAAFMIFNSYLGSSFLCGTFHFSGLLWKLQYIIRTIPSSQD